jgi:hypothetical protein
MEPNRNNPRDLTPRTSAQQPMRPRPLMSDFAPRPSAPALSPARPPQPQSAPVLSNPSYTATPQLVTTTQSAPQQARPVPASSHSVFSPPPVPVEPAHQDIDNQSHPTNHQKQLKERNRTGHAGLVGFIVFVILTGLALAPVLPGKIMQDFPGSSQSFSTGDQALGCIHTLGPVNTSLAYNSKIGFPIIYNYTATTTQQATCDGQVQTVIGGHASQFNPLGGAIDILITVVIAIVVAKIWSKFRGVKD